MKKDWRERELTMEIVVGAFLVMIFLGLAYFTIILSKESLFKEKHEMKVSFDNVQGLRVGDNVFLRGMPIGKVKDLQLDCEVTCRGVCVTLDLDMPVQLREGYEFRIVTTSLLGGQQLQITEGLPTGDLVTAEVYLGAPTHDLMRDAAAIVAEARAEIVEGDLFGRMRNIAEEFDEVITRVNAGQGVLGKLVSEEETLFTDLEASVAGVREIVDGLRAGEGMLGKLMSEDETLYNDLSAMLAGVRELVEGLQAGEGVAGRLLSGEGTKALDDLEALMASLRAIVEKVERGEGTVGRLLADDAVYQEVESAIQEVRAAVDDFRETAPITTFSSIFFGAF